MWAPPVPWSGVGCGGGSRVGPDPMTDTEGTGPPTLSSMRHCLGKVRKQGTSTLMCCSTAANTVVSARQGTSWGQEETVKPQTHTFWDTKKGWTTRYSQAPVPTPPEQHLYDRAQVRLDVHTKLPPERAAGRLQHPAEKPPIPVWEAPWLGHKAAQLLGTCPGQCSLHNPAETPISPLKKAQGPYSWTDTGA